MNYTQPEDIKKEFKIRQKKQLIVTVPFFVLIIGFIFAIDGENLPFPESFAPFLLALFFGFVIAIFIFSFTNWRCPACSKYLGKGFNPKFCKNCGTQLHD
ncbi:hypothetical protein ACFL56_01865 [Candidatus Margulisiibacteriota bacterium]